MTIESDYAPDTFNGNGVQTVYGITFNFLTTSSFVKVSLKVTATDVVTLQTDPADYSISGLNVTFVVAPPTGTVVLLELNPDFQQGSKYPENGPLPSKTVEQDLDERALEGQINKDQVARSLRLDSAVSGVSVVLPTPAADKLIQWNTSASALINVDLATLDSLSLPVSVANGGTSATTATAAASALGLGTEDSPTFSGLTVAASSTASSRIELFEDTDNGTNKVTLAAPASIASDIVITAPDATGTLLLTDNTAVVTGKSYDADGTGNVLTNVGSSEVKSELLTGQADTDIAAGDSLLFSDADDSGNLKKDTVQGILDLAAPFTEGTSTAATSGTSIDFTSIPSGTKFIYISIVGVSTNGSDDIVFQLGDSGGIETSGYLGSSSQLDSTPTVSLATDGFHISSGGSGHVRHGTLILVRENSSSNTWVASGNWSRSDSSQCHTAAGSKSLSGELDRVRMTTSGGSNTFDLGEINITFGG